jgi:hypothetical protein
MSREVGIEEVVEVIEEMASSYGTREYVDEETCQRARGLVKRLVGPERETRSRITSKYMICDAGMCAALADDLAVSEEETREWFINEPVKRVIKVCVWALDTVDSQVLENGGVHGQRGAKIAKILEEWSRHNHTGIHRHRQTERQLVEGEA